MRRRLLPIGLGVLALAAVIVWAFMPAAVPADFAVVERGPMQVTEDEEGRTRVRDRYVISAPVPGRMQRIELDPGDPVVAGKTIVARFEPSDPALLDVRTRTELEARVRAAESALGGATADRERVRADLAFAQSEAKRSRELLEQRVISAHEFEAVERQLETLQRSLESAEFAVTTARHQLEVARASLLQSRRGSAATIPLSSPVDGVVLRVFQESAAVVPTGQPLLEVGSLDDLEIVADLLSSAAVRVEPDQPVLIEQWGGDRPLRGRVRRVEPSGFTKISALGVEEQRVNTIIDFEGPREAWRSLGDGFRVEVRIIVWARDDVLKVPASSLFRYEGKTAVYKVENGRASRQIVEIGQRSGMEAEVLGGLHAGEQVVVYPSDAIADGVQVTPRS
ncbi:MAG TPA: efflux RND transporter periplasmic adaptor subunit [Vicinamibacterales bacterium]|nr:efflux RND transporter periplasmic adaptor subunit [Vicinamibacterales bacterium]